MPLFFMKLDPKAQDLDPMLVSGFFTAIQSFSKEVIERDSSMFQVDYGARLFTVISGEVTDFVIVSLGEWDDDVTPILKSLLEEFEGIWIKDLSRKEKDALKIDVEFPDFREGIVQNLSFRKLSGSWVPFLVESDGKGKIKSDSVVLSYINGLSTVDDISMNSGLGADEVVAEITRLWALGKVRFGSILSRADILASTSKIDRLLQLSSPQRAELSRRNPEVIALLPRLSMMFDGRRSVGAIIDGLAKEYKENQVMEVIDTLLETGAIVALSPEKRRLLLVQEALELAIRVAERIYTPVAARQFLNIAMNKVPATEVAGVFRMTDTSWSIDYNSRLYEHLDPRRLMNLYAEWMKLLAQYIGALDKNRILKFAEALTEIYRSYLFERYTSSDLRGFEEFTFWLEMNCLGV
ncbi:MAG: hypothetical protein C4K48_05440 [Candidatus Thorarchaeota archaeon]|nr:MAG: hypothetical protein C4K48_05440 [Candidatus Thorarchaeota archaeon]